MKNAYESRSDAARYDQARDLSQATKTQLMDTLKSDIEEQMTHIIDLGCGTGRFSLSLTQAFDCPVTGIEPSEAMLEVARKTHGSNPAITLLQGHADAIPLEPESATLVFMSQVYHHLPDVNAALAEIRRVLKSGGALAIRNTTRETNDSATLPWLRFFPDAVHGENARTPTREALRNTVLEAGFTLSSANVIEQVFAASPTEYAVKIGHRGLSTLVMLEDEAFSSGMSKLYAWAAEQPDVPIYEPLELVVFRKR